ncbi:FAD-dependent oxidoreductase [Clostridium sp. AL.422]|uniref:FAD-dependent oxidoreductase n=1 Tax=Clostridium TaxID=1485 RepID=UPI00293DFD77|nr:MULTISPECIES: FAD-dependent oxidoreductase [unclassified Clostridium]MDV4151081.1 FAD-dependent oxidoreductase [Clostridium sp. AL.422]
MKVVVVGCTHAGTSAVVNLKILYPDAEIVVYEKNDNISFLSCGIALSVGKIVTEPEKLFYNSPEKLEESGVTTRMKHEVLDIDFDNKKIKVKDLTSNEEIEDSYDKLLLTLGSWPIIPKLEGIELDNILLCKNYHHAKIIDEKKGSAKNVIIIGAGYIGVELAEAFERLGKKVTLIDAEDRIMSKYLDKEFSDVAEKEFTSRGIKLVLGEKVVKFNGSNGKVEKVITDKGEYEGDLVVLCIGFRPNTKLIEGKLDTLKNGAIIIDDYMRTSKEDVFAAGDCCMVKYNPAKDNRYIPLATNAVRMGMLIARNIEKPSLKYMGTQGTSGIKIYDVCISSTGLTVESAKATTNLDVDSIIIHENNRPEFMPTFDDVMVKLVFEKESKRIVGGQIASKVDVTEFMNTLSVVIQNDMTIEELAMTDFFFQPHFNKPWGILNQVALKKID